MNGQKNQTVVLGATLIGLGVVWWLNLWWLVAPAALVGAGIVGYNYRRQLGRPVEAVQAGLWCIGLALILVLNFWAGLLLLAGASILIRGREETIDARVQQTIGQARSRRLRRPATSLQPPVVIEQQPATPPNSVGNETHRL